MTQIIVVGGTKGGPGKSTVAQQIAACLKIKKKKKVQITDIDIQRTTTGWCEDRRGRLMLEKGRQLLSAARDLEKQAQQLSAGWERELAIALDASFPFSALLPLIAEFYAQNPQTRLNFSHHTLAGSWEELTHHGADIILGAINEPPTSAEWSWQTLGALDNIFVVAPHHPLAQAKEPLANKQLSQHRAIVIRDSARYCHPLNSNLLDEQPQIGVDDFASKVELLCARWARRRGRRRRKGRQRAGWRWSAR